jgi:hypothetical protein
VGVGDGCGERLGVGWDDGAVLVGRGLGDLDGGGPDDGLVLGDGLALGEGPGEPDGDPEWLAGLVFGDLPEDPGLQRRHGVDGVPLGGRMVTAAPKS